MLNVMSYEISYLKAGETIKVWSLGHDDPERAEADLNDQAAIHSADYRLVLTDPAGAVVQEVHGER